MLGYTYDYKTFEEILSLTGTLSDMNATEFLFTIITLGVVIGGIFTFFPLLIITHKHNISEKKKREKKKLLSQILLQKEIEDEVENEIKLKEES